MQTMKQATVDTAFLNKPWNERKADARPFLRSASELARALGPLQQANDGTPAALACALVNGELREAGWCDCQKHSSANDCFYIFPDGQHGWMCSNCCRVTQIG